MIKKIKKSVAVVAVLLLMSSSLNATVLGDVDCNLLAVDVFQNLLDEGYSYSEAYFISGIVEQNCLNQQ